MKNVQYLVRGTAQRCGGFGNEAVFKLVCSGPDAPVTSSRGQRLEQVEAGMKSVLYSLPCSGNAVKVVTVVQGGKRVADDFLGDYILIRLPPCRWYMT